MIAPNLSVHAGIFVFPNHKIPIDSMIKTCMTVMKNEKTGCNGPDSITEDTELMVDLNYK